MTDDFKALREMIADVADHVIVPNYIEAKIGRQACIAVPRLLAEYDRMREALERIQKGCRWYWPEDDTSSESCSNSPHDIALDASAGEICAVARGGVIETRYYAWLPPADDADSDDEFLVNEANEADAKTKISAEIARRKAILAMEPPA
jgi:hypothetical protein